MKNASVYSGEISTATADFLPKQEIKGIPEAQLQPTAMISLINNVQKEVTGAQLSAAALLNTTVNYLRGRFPMPRFLISTNTRIP